MGNKYEIERRFLVEFTDITELNVVRRIGIVQTYLKTEVADSQRRVRAVEENGKVEYIYTEKIFITPTTRDEKEYEISRERYQELLDNERDDCPPVEKVRYCFEYKDQLFELDKYSFSDELAIMEIELHSPDQKIDFPDNVKVLKDVTADRKGYSNASLAVAGRFPEQKIGEYI